MGKTASFLLGAAAAAGLMYLFDPKEGNRRRALLRDKLVHLSKVTEQKREGASQDVGNRLRGLAAEVRGRLRSEPVSDDILVARVRSQMGHVVSHPSAISVSAQDGRVTLSGAILAGEARRLLTSTAAVRGVKGVDDRLQMHEKPESIPGLQRNVPAPTQQYY